MCRPFHSFSLGPALSLSLSLFFSSLFFFFSFSFWRGRSPIIQTSKKTRPFLFRNPKKRGEERAKDLKTPKRNRFADGGGGGGSGGGGGVFGGAKTRAQRVIIIIIIIIEQ